MKKYLIALDLDGTLLDDQSLIPKNTKNYLIDLQQQGHKIVIATGRPFRGATEFYEELQLSTPLITDNGALIHPYNETGFNLFAKTIPAFVVNDIYNFTKDFLHTAFFNVYDDLYIHNYFEEHYFYYHLNDKSKIIKGPINQKGYPEPHLILLAIHADKDQIFEEFISKNHSSVSLRRWWKDDTSAVYEVHLKDCSKGKAVLDIAKFYNIEKENIISFGDGSNDIDLLSKAGLGVKMINGSKRLTEYDDLTTYTNDEEGVMHYLKSLLHKKTAV